MSEEEIIDTVEILENTDISRIELAENVDLRTYQLAVNNLLDLYKQEKERLKIATAMLTRGTYPEQNEGDNDFDKHFISKDKIRNDLKICQEVFEKEMKPYQTEYGLDVTYLSKKEKAELINKRNCLLTQMKTYEMLLEEK